MTEFAAALLERTMTMKLLAAALRYFACVFGAGFVLGTLRVPWLVPRLGVRTAELLEMPVMGGVIFFAARGLVRGPLAGSDRQARLAVGLFALGLLLAAELVLGFMLQGLGPRELIAARDPVSGSVYALMLMVYAVLPAWLPTPRSSSRMPRSTSAMRR